MENHRAQIEDANFVDLVVKDNEPHFLSTRFLPQKGIVLQLDKVVNGVSPPPRAAIPWGLPRYEAVEEAFYNDTPERLFEDTLIHLRERVGLGSRGEYVLVASHISHTYFLQRFTYSPMLGIYGPKEDSGKSLLGQTVAFASYRGIVLPSVREAYLVRITEAGGCFLFIDFEDVEFALKQSGTAKDLILSRFQRGSRVPRITNPKAKGSLESIDHYETFGPTAWATNVPVKPTTESRSIVLTMTQAERTYPEPDEGAGLRLRERYVAFVARSKSSWNTIPSLRRPFLNRLGNLAGPLIFMVEWMAPKYLDDLLQVLTEKEQERTAERSSSDEADLAAAAIQAWVKGGKAPEVATAEIATIFNADRGSYPWSADRVGKRIRNLGLKPGASRRARRTLEVNETGARDLARRWGIDFEAIDSTPVAGGNGQDKGNLPSTLALVEVGKS